MRPCLKPSPFQPKQGVRCRVFRSARVAFKLLINNVLQRYERFGVCFMFGFEFLKHKTRMLVGVLRVRKVVILVAVHRDEVR